MITTSAADRARSLFTRRFGVPPAIVASAPGRVNLIGEHVDYTGGLVLPFAIDARAAVALGPSEDDRTTLCAPDLDTEMIHLGPPPRRPETESTRRFANHLLGVLHAAGGSETPIRALVTSDVPSGGGLSSSAAIEVAFATAWAGFTGGVSDPATIARLAMQAEHEFVGTPCGIMDMLVSAAGRAEEALRIDCRSVTWRPVPMPSEDRALVLLVDSGITHRLRDGGYAERRAACERAEAALGGSLRDATNDDIAAAALDATDRRRASHVVEENRRVDAMVAALEIGDLETAGRLLIDGHHSLRDRFEVSIPEIDHIVEIAERRRESGCLGARLTGGGFGGSALVLVTTETLEANRNAIVADFASRFERRPATRVVRASPGALLES
ncbi:MAG: galactokinase [Phycisphaerae bacterium]|nr:galactokinase [Phycisphaerae bacterium]OUX00956.1 MAG: galactokinase [Phycisphaeraceae bacterium TMED231]